MCFESAGMADIDRLVELRLAYLREDLGALSAGDEARIRSRLPDYFRRHLGCDLTALAARDGAAIVACAWLLAVEKPMSPAFINGKTGMVLNVYTRPEYRGRGYARRLMEMLMKEAASQGLCVVELKATRMGYGLYKSLGFEDAGTDYRGMIWKTASRSHKGANT
ncbi:MAG: GNAT family N-acetyltransferase [Clostridia bacterium]|nr:GNAT family N-acetyltransferase [Clostridia bacterium]